jgi:hypothetical protein
LKTRLVTLWRQTSTLASAPPANHSRFLCRFPRRLRTRVRNAFIAETVFAGTPVELVRNLSMTCAGFWHTPSTLRHIAFWKRVHDALCSHADEARAYAAHVLRVYADEARAAFLREECRRMDARRRAGQ